MKIFAKQGLRYSLSVWLPGCSLLAAMLLPTAAGGQPAASGQGVSAAVATTPTGVAPAVSVTTRIAPVAANAAATALVEHGSAAPVGQRAFGRTQFAVDCDGKRMVFAKLWAGPGSSYVLIDAETGALEQIFPERADRGGWPVLLTADCKAYDTIGDSLIEVDLKTRTARAVGKVPPRMALGYAQDAEGVVYAGFFPNAHIVSYNPKTGKMRNYGPVVRETWDQYPRPIVPGNDGWLYIAMGAKLGQVLALNLETGEKKAFVPQADRKRGYGEVYRGVDGKIYASAPGWSWHVLENGNAVPLSGQRAKPEPVDDRTFADGSKWLSVDLPNRKMTVQDKDGGEPRTVTFDYKSPGVRIYNIVAGEDGMIYGATGVPLRVWRFDPKTGVFQNWGMGGNTGHVNQFVALNGKLYGGIYSSGSLIEYDPAKPFTDASLTQSANPRLLHGFRHGHKGKPDLFGRPYGLLAHPDKAHVIMGGNPSRVQPGGGLLIYNTLTGQEQVLMSEELVPGQGVMAMTALKDGNLLLGSTTVAPTAGNSAAKDAVLSLLDWKTRKVIWSWKFEPRAASIVDLVTGEDGLVYGITNNGLFFVFDPQTRSIVRRESLERYGDLGGAQAPRVMAFGPDGRLYLLFREAIVRLDTKDLSHKALVKLENRSTAGIAILGNRLYFASDGVLYSYDLAAGGQ